MVLVTTALEETFPKDKNEKILFLGEWCKLYSRKDFYEQYNYKTLPYHWDDREKLYEDTKYIDVVYEKYLNLLRENLNRIHNVDFSISYWRIILGPWLRYFIEMVYDRYLSILFVSKMDNIDHVNIFNFKDEDIVPNNMKDFSKLYIDDWWNQFIYQNIMSHFDIKTKSINIKVKDNLVKKENKVPLKNIIKNTFFFLNKFNSTHFFSSYIKLSDLCQLQIKLGQVPTLGTTIDITFNTIYSHKLRNSLKFTQSNSLFENILTGLIKKQIPKYYIEGYSEFRDKVLSVYPKKSKIIFTANAYSSDDAFKFWAAEKKEAGTKYVIGQHGGNFGMGLFASHEKHQIKSADKFFSWGWQLKSNDKVIPVAAIKLDQKIGYNPKGDILIPLSSFPRQSYHIMAMPISNQTLNMIEDQVDYLKLASSNLKELLKLRIYQHDYMWSFKERFIDKGYSSYIDNQDNLNKSFYQRLSECRLCISTYNATTYLETLSANYPTLLYWNPLHWELNSESKPYFKLLEDAGILHYTAKSLYQKLKEIYKNPMKWWQTEKVQKARKEFCYQYARTSENWADEWIEEFNIILEENART